MEQGVAEPKPPRFNRRGKATGDLDRAGPTRRNRALLLTTYVAILILGWHLFVTGFGIRSYLLPGPSGVAETMAAQANLLVRATLITSYEALVGLGLAALSGIGLAIVVVQSSYLRTIVMPSLVAVNAMPKVAVAPILIIWLGLGLWSKIAMAFLLSFFPIVINTVRGLSDVEPALIEYFRLLKASEFQTFFKARFPNALPAVFDGLKIALPIAVIGAVIGEFVASRQGIGYQIIRAYSSFDTEMVFAAVIAISVVSTLLFQALVSLERRVISWRPPEMR